MNNMAVCNYIVGQLGAVVGGLIMQASAQFPLEFTENGPGQGVYDTLKVPRKSIKIP